MSNLMVAHPRPWRSPALERARGRLRQRELPDHRDDVHVRRDGVGGAGEDGGGSAGHGGLSQDDATMAVSLATLCDVSVRTPCGFRADWCRQGRTTAAAPPPRRTGSAAAIMSPPRRSSIPVAAPISPP